MNKKLKVLVSGIIVAVLLVFGVSLFVEKIPAGYVGVVYSVNGGVDDEILTQGWHIVSPTKKVTRYSVATEQLYMSKDSQEGSENDDSFDVICSDGKMNVDFEMSYSFDPDKVCDIYTRYRGLSGKEIVDTIVRGKIKTKVSEITSKFTVIEAHMEKKAELNQAITAGLKDYLGEFGITVESANLTRTSVDPAVEEAIVERSKVSQELEIERQKQKKAKLEAETLMIETQGAADRALIKANNEAEVMLIEANAEAEANRIKSQSLTSLIIEEQAIEKWNGVLPTVSSENAAIVADVLN